MRFGLLARGSSAAVIAFGALLGASAIAQQQPPPAPAAGQAPPAAAQPAQPAAAQPAQPATAQPSQPAAGGVALDPKQKAEQDAKADNAMHTPSGKAGKQEPNITAPHQSDAGPVLLHGRLNVPGAPADSQTVPAKFSERNARLDKLPTMAFPLGLTDAQRQRIVAGVQSANAPIAKLDARLSDELPTGVALNDLPPQLMAEVPAVSGLMYVRTADRVLLIEPANRIVVGEVMVGGVKG
jgi:hypothetical protein